MSARLLVWAVAAASLALVAGALIAYHEGGPGIPDTPVYRHYGEDMAAGRVPYRDFGVEYPPGALLPFVVPALLTSTQTAYDSDFSLLVIVCLAVASALVVLSLGALRVPAGRIGFAVVAFWVGIGLLGSFLMTRFDVYAATVTLAATSAILWRRRVLGPLLLGLAIATKIYPAVLLPLLAARAAREDGRREAVRAVGITLATVAVVYLPFLVVAPAGVSRSLSRQLGRPLQIESLGSSVLLALHHAFGMPLAWASGSGSQNLVGTVADVASAGTTILGVLALLLVWARFARGDAGSDERFVRYAAAAVVAFVAFGKVLSPQFLAWVVAAVVLVQGRRGLAAVGVVLAACALTRLWFPRTYWLLVKEFDPTASGLLFGRDLLLVTLFAILVVRAREPAPGSSRSPVR